MKSLSHVRLFATPWTVAYQAPQSTEFSRQEYRSGSLLYGIFLTQGSNLGLPHCWQMLYRQTQVSCIAGRCFTVEPGSPALRADTLPSEHQPAVRETRVQSLCQEDPVEKEMATHSGTLAWKIPWTEEHGRLQSMGSQRVGHD